MQEVVLPRPACHVAVITFNPDLRDGWSNAGRPLQASVRFTAIRDERVTDPKTGRFVDYLHFSLRGKEAETIRLEHGDSMIVLPDVPAA